MLECSLLQHKRGGFSSFIVRIAWGGVAVGEGRNDPITPEEFLHFRIDRADLRFTDESATHSGLIGNYN